MDDWDTFLSGGDRTSTYDPSSDNYGAGWKEGPTDTWDQSPVDELRQFVKERQSAEKAPDNWDDFLNRAEPTPAPQSLGDAFGPSGRRPTYNDVGSSERRPAGDMTFAPGSGGPSGPVVLDETKWAADKGRPEVEEWAGRKFRDAPVQVMGVPGWEINLGKEVGSKTLGGVGWTPRDVIEKTIPFTEFQDRKDEERYGEAVRAFNADKATPEQMGRIAEHRLRQQRESAKSKTRKLTDVVASAPKVLGEFYVAGPAMRGAAAAAGGGFGAGLLGLAAGSPLITEGYVKESQQNANENGGDWFDPQNVAVPLAKNAVGTVILGQVGKTANSEAVANTASTVLGRFGAKSAVAAAAMPIESLGTEALTGAVQDVLQKAGLNDYLDPKEKRYQTFRDMKNGKWGDVGTKLAGDSIMGWGFSTFHGREAKPIEALESAAEALAKKGYSKPKVAEILADAVKDPESAKGPAKEFAETLAEAQKPPEVSEKPSPDERRIPSDEIDPNSSGGKDAIKPPETAPEPETARSAPEAEKVAPEAPQEPYVGPERRQRAGESPTGVERRVLERAVGDRLEDLGDGNFTVTHGDRFIAVTPAGKNRVAVNFDFGTEKPGSLEAPAGKGMKAGTKDLFTDLDRIAKELHKTGTEIEYTASPVKGEGGRKSRKDLYASRLEKAGFEQVQEGDATKPSVWRPKPPEKPAAPERAEAPTPATKSAAQMVAEKIAQTNMARSTAKEADFGPKAQAEAEQTGRSIVQRITDNFRELGGSVAPRLSRMSEESGNKLARHISARAAGLEEAPLLIDKVLPEPVKNGYDMDTLVGSVLTEMRLRHMREAFLAKGDEKAAEKVQTVVGRALEKGGDPLENPLMSEAQYQAALKSPDVQEALARYREHVVPTIEAQYKEALGMDAGEDVPTFTQIPGMPMNLKRWQPGDSGAGFGPKAGNLKNPKANRYAFSRRATGSAEGYSTSLSEIIGHSVMSARDAGTKAAMYRQLVQDGVAKPARPGERPEGFDHHIPNAFGPGGLKNLAEPGQTSLWFKDEAAMKEVRKALDVDLPWKKVPLSGLFNKATLASLGEATAHTKNLMTMMVRPGMSPLKLLTNAVKLIRNDMPTRERLAELAQIGALKPKGFESENFNTTHKLNPLTWTGKFLDFVDRSTRLTADDAFKKLSLREGVKKTEGARRDFINQLGQYNRRAQNDLVQFARDTGLGPFATAGTNFNINGIRQLLGLHGVKTTSKAADLRLRMEMIGRMAAVASVVPLVNFLKAGRVDGDDNTPIGAISLGKGDDGRSRYFDLLGLTGFTRGLRETGLLAMAEGARPGAKRAGSTTSSSIDRAVEDVFHATAHPFMGPTVQLGEISLTGKNTIGMKVAKQAKGNENQTAYNLLAAAIQANPVVAAILAATGVDPAARKTSAEREAMKQLGPYGVKSSAAPPGKPYKK